MTYICDGTRQTLQRRGKGAFDLKRCCGCLTSKFPFTDRSAQRRFKSNTPNAICWTKHAHFCVYMILFLPPANSQRAHKRQFTSTFALCSFCFGYTACSLHQIMLHSTTSCHYFLFLVRLEVFGLCCVHISFEPHQSSFGTETHLFTDLGPLVWCAPGVGIFAR